MDISLDVGIIQNLIDDYQVVSESLLASNRELVSETKKAFSKMLEPEDDYEYNLYASILDRNLSEMDRNIGLILYAKKDYVESYLNNPNYESTLNNVLARLCLFSISIDGNRTLNYDWDQTGDNKRTIVNLKDIGYIAYVNDLRNGLGQRKIWRFRVIDVD
jgi:hypothetical protein